MILNFLKGRHFDRFPDRAKRDDLIKSRTL